MCGKINQQFQTDSVESLITVFLTLGKIAVVLGREFGTINIYKQVKHLKKQTKSSQFSFITHQAFTKHYTHRS